MKHLPLTRADERLIVALRTRKRRSRKDLFLAEGLRVAEEALAAGLVLRFAVKSSSLEDSSRGAELATRLDATTNVHHVPESVMRRLAATDSPQGVLLVAEIPEWPLPEVEQQTRPIILVLDGVQDPGNFGTLVRSAEAFAASGVIALPGTVDPWNPKAVRAAAGSSFRVPVAQVELDEAIAWLRERAFLVLAADVGGTPLGEVELGERVGLIVGNEGSGLRSTTKAAADHVVAVPIPGRAESLNVAVAAGILLDRIRARR